MRTIAPAAISNRWEGEMRACAAILLLVTSWTFCSDRCVLIEFFTWNASPYDPLVASDVEDFLDEHPGTASLVAIHNASSSDPVYQGNPEHHNARRAYYGISGYPTIMLDGFYDVWPYEALSDFYLIRVNTPCALEVQVIPSENSTEYAGTISFYLSTESGLDTDARIHAMISESGIPGTGTYSGWFFNYGLRWNLFGAYGEPLTFGSSPEVVEMSADYSIDPSWDWNQLYLTTFVQCDSTREVMNSHMIKMSDLVCTGIGGYEWSVPEEPIILHSNPASGAIRFTTPGREPPVEVRLYNLQGTLIEVAQTGRGSFTPACSGVYLLRLSFRNGDFSTCKVVFFTRR